MAMFQDRRQHPRHPVLVKCALTSGKDRRDVICTQIGPSGAFFSTRADGLAVGQALTLEMRSGGLDTPMVTLQAELVRIVPAGSTWPVGFAVRWQSATCELGANALVHFLDHTLHMPGLQAGDVAGYRHVEFNITTHLAQLQAGRPSVGRASEVVGLLRRSEPRPAMASSGRWDATASPTPTPMDATVSRRFAATAEVSPPPLPTPQARLASRQLDPGRPSEQGAKSGTGQIDITGMPVVGQRTGAFASGPQTSPSLEAAIPPLRKASTSSVLPAITAASAITGQSGRAAAAPTPSASSMSSSAIAVVLPPVDRLAKPATEKTPGLGWRPPAFSISRMEDPFDGQSAGESAASRRPSAEIAAADASKVFDSARTDASRLVGGAAPQSSIGQDALSQSWPVYALSAGERRFETPQAGPRVPGLSTHNFDMGAEKTSVDGRNSPMASQIGPLPTEVPQQAVVRGPSRTQGGDNHVMRRVDRTVRYTCASGMFSGRVVALGSLAAAVITTEAPPQFDEPVVIHLPLDTPVGPLTVRLHGKLLQIAAETEQGPRFVLHIERVDEGPSPGAYLRFLDGLSR